MLTLTAPTNSQHGGKLRRSFLKASLLGIGGAAIPSVVGQPTPVFAQAATSRTAIIQIFLSGGPSQHDTFDPKPDAPAEYRGPFQSIPTRLPDVRVTEYFPRIAGLTDKLTILRSVYHGDGSHHHA